MTARLIVLAIVWCLGSACIVVPGARGGPGYAQPVLVPVAPGVWVVEDYHTAVFFAHDHYWYYDGDLWYRSRWYDADWVVVQVTVVPAPVVKLDRTRYVWYRAPAGAERKQAKGHEIDAPPGHGGKVPGHGGTPPGHGKGRDKKGKKKKR